MTFYCITKGDEYEDRIGLLKKSCKKYNIIFKKIDINKFNFLNNLNLSKNDFLYRVCPSKESLEAWYFLLNRKVTTFYNSYEYAITERPNSFIIFQKEGLPIPKTINYINNNKVLLKKYVNNMGGFPIIIKVMGSSCGTGVIKIDSFQSLYSVMDYLAKRNIYTVMREFIRVGKPVFSCRAIVLGNEVEIAYKNINISLKDDFRSNVDQKRRKRELMELSKKNKNILIKSVAILGSDLGAVDFVFDKKGNLKIFEVNFPFNFVPVVKDLKYKINDKMIEYLIKKSKSKLS